MNDYVSGILDEDIKLISKTGITIKSLAISNYHIKVYWYANNALLFLQNSLNQNQYKISIMYTSF